jgi:hypothetical protein
VRVLSVFALAAVCASLVLAAAAPTGHIVFASVSGAGPSGGGPHRLTTWAAEQIQPSWGR